MVADWKGETGEMGKKWVVMGRRGSEEMGEEIVGREDVKEMGREMGRDGKESG